MFDRPNFLDLFFTPRRIPALSRWYSASNIALADGAAIDSWPDASQFKRPATAAGTGRPTLQTNEINGRSVVRFDGSNDVITIPQVYAKEWTVVLVGNFAASGASQVVADDTIDEFLGYQLIFLGATNEVLVGYGDGDNMFFANAGVLGSTRIFVWRARLGEVQYWVNGGTPKAVNSGTPSTSNVEMYFERMGLLADGVSHPLNGDVAEYLIFRKRLGADLINKLGRYFAKRYALTWSNV